jgi:predicted TPR repeat methyltransferase
LRNSGLLLFTLETMPGPDDVDHRLQFHGRYAHNERYVRAALTDARLAIDSIARETLRQERGESVAGFVITARRRE